MTVWNDLAVDEQAVLLDALHGASVIVSVASPGRKEETASEGFEAAAFILDSRDAQVGNPLTTSMILMFEEGARDQSVRFPDYLALVSAPDARERSLAALRAGVELLDRRVEPDEALGFKRWLLEIATVTAQAGKEDQGFLGRGGVLVNDKERAAIQEVAEALGLPA